MKRFVQKILFSQKINVQLLFEIIFILRIFSPSENSPTRPTLKVISLLATQWLSTFGLKQFLQIVCVRISRSFLETLFQMRFLWFVFFFLRKFTFLYLYSKDPRLDFLQMLICTSVFKMWIETDARHFSKVIFFLKAPTIGEQKIFFFFANIICTDGSGIVKNKIQKITQKLNHQLGLI